MVVKFSNIPTSSQWITFPVSAKDQVTINWEDNGNKYENTYHVAKCYYGILEELVPPPECVMDEKLQVPNPVIYKGKKRLTVLGETKLFIAAEFFEEEYARSPSDLVHFHLKDIARKAEAVEELGESPWVTMKLNEVFCYGQSYDIFYTRRRYIVYHPCIGPGIRRPNIHQHRFTGTDISDAAMKGLEGSAKQLPKKYKPLGSLLAQFGKLLHSTGQATLGNYLWVFLDERYLTKVNKDCPEPEFLGDEAKLQERLRQIQILELKGTGKTARDFKRNNLLAPPGDKSVSSGQPENVPNLVPGNNDQELAADLLRQKMETLLIKIDNCADGLQEIKNYTGEEGEDDEREEEAERKELEEKKGRPHNSQYTHLLRRVEQNNSGIRGQIIGDQPHTGNSLIDDNTGGQSPRDTSVLGILQTQPEQTQPKRTQSKIIITTQVPGHKPATKKRIAVNPESPIHQNDPKAPATLEYVYPEQERDYQERPEDYRSRTRGEGH